MRLVLAASPTIAAPAVMVGNGATTWLPDVAGGWARRIPTLGLLVLVAAPFLALLPIAW